MPGRWTTSIALSAVAVERLGTAAVTLGGAPGNRAFVSDAEEQMDTDDMPQADREFLDGAIADYNAMFKTSFGTDAKGFDGYYKDVSQRMKNGDLDLLIVVDMFLTGFDAKALNTFWVDKNLRMHGLVQAFSRTNRILNSVKTFGNIVCFRDLSQEVDEAVSLFGDAAADVDLAGLSPEERHDVVSREWRNHVARAMEDELGAIIESEGLKPEETRRFVTEAFEIGEVPEEGTAVRAIMPGVSRFSKGGNYGEGRRRVVDLLSAFYERFRSLTSRYPMDEGDGE